MIILANDGISTLGKTLLEEKGFQVDTDKINQEDLIKQINQRGYSALLVRSDTKVRKELIDACPNLKLIGRGGVGMDNIDVDYAKSKGLAVINTPASSSLSVAELVLGYMFSLARSLHLANREMPIKGSKEFKILKKSYSKTATELRGKKLGIIGLGRIGKRIAENAALIGMDVVFFDNNLKDNTEIKLEVANQKIKITVQYLSFDELLSSSDYISINMPKVSNEYLITELEFNKMKKGVKIINTSRGGLINETDLINAINKGIVLGAALDVFEEEPTPKDTIINHPKIAVSPHIGGSTLEAQERIGEELAKQIIQYFGN